MSLIQAHSYDREDNRATISQQLLWLSSRIQTSNNYNLNLVLEKQIPNISSVAMMQDIFKTLEVANNIKRELSGNLLKDSDLREYLERELACVSAR